MDKTIGRQNRAPGEASGLREVHHPFPVVHAHDEENKAGMGDTVLVAESRPMSKSKSWTLVEVRETATQI